MHPTVRMRDALLALRVALCVRSGSIWEREEGCCQHWGCEMQTKLKSVNLSHVVSSGTETEDKLTEPSGGGQGMRRGQWNVRAAVIKSAFVVECLIAHRVRAKVTTALAPRPMCAPLGTLSVACHRRQLD